ncbi:uncharacterized protein CELE_W03C9.1 [Caenorhabditis elegans]|uniref:Uncharacterized protein n=1 Tax=Caenorhabditis elegans TaxID=6239 RepID=Q23147_CAEEL|nr:Uncharacterized protein CELE_W03C9.1 [Caenorhabditis elegans]CAA91358.3 Uncharacterized protein CELE_W03C9.1 [Caenorhabditis elegans]|eukprot:NP_496547.3 Uncharacterized protein CELE_W03C9.1 [Caenorhabditis elegans]
MQQDQFFLIVTFPFLVTSFALVSCLKTAWKFKGSADPSEAYTKTLPVAVKPKKDEKKIKPGKTVKKVDGKDKKAKKLSKFFVFNHGKDEDLKTAVGSEPTLDSTQESITEDDEHESPLSDNYKFSDDEKLDGLQILPSPPPKYVEKLRSRVRQTRRGKKSPQDYYCTDEEDSLFDVPSLKIDPATLKSSRSSIPLNIQDSRLLRLNQDRLAFKKSHTVYPHSAISPHSNRMHRSESRSSRESEPTTISQRS